MRLKNKFHIILFVLGCVFILSHSLSASTVKTEYYESDRPVNTFTDKEWKNSIGEIDYTPPVIKEKKRREEARRNRNNNNNNVNPTPPPRRNQNRNTNINTDSSGIGGAFFKILLIALLIGALAFIVYRMAGGSLDTSKLGKAKRKGTVTSNIDLENVEKNLHKSDMEILIDKALADNNYMLAVRLYYLWSIKELSQKKLIKWKRDKTNRDYIRELRTTGADLHKPFRDNTRIFERVWYGDQKEIDRNQFKTLQSKLHSFVDSIKKK